MTREKYNTKGSVLANVFIRHGLTEDMSSLLAARSNMALAENTKSNYDTVKRNIQRCEVELECSLDFPWSISQTLHFIAYLLFTRKVKSKTVTCQLSGVRMAHIELGFDNPNLRTPLINLILRGTEHWDNIQKRLLGNKSRTPVTIDMMKVIKRKLIESKLKAFNKIIFWSACTLIWNGSLRVHEALSRSQTEFDPQTTLLMDDVQVINENINKTQRSYIRILIKSPKEDRVGKDMWLEIFGNDTFLCPLKAMSKYVNERAKINTTNRNLPFFITKDLKGYTGKDFNMVLSELTDDITRDSEYIIRSHSLRAGVPSELAKRGVDPLQIQGVGRWSSDAWKDYCKLGRKKRLNITDSLCSSIV